jgi:predicted nucleic-acid-binding protein
VRAADTNVVVRLLVRDDERQVAIAEAFVAPGAWVALLVLAEAVWVLSTVYELDAAAVASAVGLLLEHRDLVVQDADTVGAALARFKKHPGLGFSDCLVLEVARKAGHLPLGTFDRDLARLEGAQRLK